VNSFKISDERMVQGLLQSHLVEDVIDLFSLDDGIL
jgi:hypothetical protein